MLTARTMRIPGAATYHAVGVDIGRSNLLSLFNRLLADDLYPVTIGILDESNVLHTPISQLLLEDVASIFNTLACGMDVVDGDAGVAKTAMGLLIAVVGLVVGIVLGAVVVSQLDDALTVKHLVAVGAGTRPIVSQEVEVELGFGKLKLTDNGHAEKFVKFDCEYVSHDAGEEG